MINNQENDSGYQFLSVVLLESYFNRISSVTTDTTQIDANINIDSSSQTQDNMINVILILTFLSKNKISLNKEIEAKIKMVGKFVKSGESKLDSQIFAQQNAPAIMFPYLREHLSNLSLRAGIPPIILPPINFVALEKTKKIRKS